jgi:hypothetical protein
VYTFVHHIHPHTPFPRHLSPPTGASLPAWAGLVLPLFCNFCKRQKREDKMKNMTFLLVWDKSSYTGSFLMIVSCIYGFLFNSTNWFISSNFLNCTLFPFLW